MRGLDPVAMWSRCVFMPAKARLHAPSATSVSRGELPVSQGFLAPGFPAASKRFGRRRSGVSRVVFFRGKVARIGYAADGVGFLTSLAQSTDIRDVPRRVERKATCAPTRMNGNGPQVGAAGLGMCVGASVDGRKPCVNGVRSGAAGRCSDGTAPARGVQRRIRFVGQRMALA
jgi:hypothetical protein